MRVVSSAGTLYAGTLNDESDDCVSRNGALALLIPLALRGGGKDDSAGMRRPERFPATSRRPRARPACTCHGHLRTCWRGDPRGGPPGAREANAGECISSILSVAGSFWALFGLGTSFLYRNIIC